MTAVETDGLTRRFGDVTAVGDLSLAVEEGEVFGFLGPNGAGKSTTISLLLGFLAPTDGSATVLGHDAAAESRAVRRRTGLLPEGFEAVPNLTGREHVEAAIETKGADDDPDELLDRVGLDPADARRPADDYSTGMFQRMALAVALVGEPDLLVLDEPSSGLDPNGVRLVREIVREERDRGATVFFSSHILDEVERVCDRVGILQDGRLTAVNSVENLRTDLGMGAVVEATVDAVPADLDLAAVDGVTDVEVDGSTVRAACASPSAKMPVLRALDGSATVEDEGLDVFGLFGDNVTLSGGVAPVRAYAEELMDDVLQGTPCVPVEPPRSESEEVPVVALEGAVPEGPTGVAVDPLYGAVASDVQFAADRGDVGIASGGGRPPDRSGRPVEAPDVRAVRDDQQRLVPEPDVAVVRDVERPRYLPGRARHGGDPRRVGTIIGEHHPVRAGVRSVQVSRRVVLPLESAGLPVEGPERIVAVGARLDEQRSRTVRGRRHVDPPRRRALPSALARRVVPRGERPGSVLRRSHER